LSEGLSSIGITIGLPGLNWAMPLGISFFTLQAIGYLADVYLKRVSAEHNWWDYMLFISFFPQIASGPISKASDLLPQIKAERKFSYGQAIQGLKWILWGMFMKVVVADTLGLQVDVIYGNYQNYGGQMCLMAALFYSFQLYCDFAGYSFMAIGVGELLGFELINNFRRPYFSVSVTDFWRRWHISLSTWLKDYIYIPLGGNHCSKACNYLNIFITFVVSGFWHGANWTFIAWGGLHGLFQVMEKSLGLRNAPNNVFLKIIRIFISFTIIIFFGYFFVHPLLLMLSILLKIYLPILEEVLKVILLAFCSSL
jgi:alginate O-acetyltransferase complex protein AlgI